MEKIRAIIKRPDEAGHVSWISNTLENLQRNVGGYIEVVPVTADLVVVCDEEGRLKDYEYNCTIAGHNFYGDILLLGVDGCEFTDCPMSLKDFKAWDGGTR